MYAYIIYIYAYFTYFTYFVYFHIQIFDMLIDAIYCAAFGDSKDDDRFDPESEALPSPAHTPPQDLPQTQPVPSNADQSCLLLEPAGRA